MKTKHDASDASDAREASKILGIWHTLCGHAEQLFGGRWIQRFDVQLPGVLQVGDRLNDALPVRSVSGYHLGGRGCSASGAALVVGGGIVGVGWVVGRGAVCGGGVEVVWAVGQSVVGVGGVGAGWVVGRNVVAVAGFGAVAGLMSVRAEEAAAGSESVRTEGAATGKAAGAVRGSGSRGITRS